MSLTNLTLINAYKNYISNSTLETDTTGYSTYANGAATPTNGTGGSPTLTFALNV